MDTQGAKVAISGAFLLVGDLEPADLAACIRLERADGDVWTVNQNTSNASRLHIDPVTLEPAPHPTTGNMVDTFPVGYAPYTYSDFTGLALRTVTRPSGDYIVQYEGCPDMEKAHWDAVEFDASAPAGSAVQI